MRIKTETTNNLNLELLSKYEVYSPFCINLYNYLIDKVLNKNLINNDLLNLTIPNTKHISYIYYKDESVIKNFNNNNKNLILEKKSYKLNYLLNKINNNVNKFTNGDIKKIYTSEEEIKSDTIVISIVYFESKWKVIPVLNEIKFLNMKEEKKLLKSIKFDDYFNVKITENYTLCEIPYESQHNSLILVKSNKINDVNIDNNILKVFTKNNNNTKACIIFPVIKKNSIINLNNIFENFKEFGDKTNQNILHIASIIIDENGSKGAGVVYSVTRGISEKKYIEFNNTFKYYIYNKQFNIVLFSGIFDG